MILIIEKKKNADPSLGFRVLRAANDCPRAAEVLCRYLTHSDPTMRMSAAEACRGTHNGDLVRALEQTVTDPDARVREKAIPALVSTPSTEAVRIMVAAIQDCDRSVQVAAVDALVVQGSFPATHRPLGELLRSLKRQAKETCTRALEGEGKALKEAETSSGDIEPLPELIWERDEVDEMLEELSEE